MIDNIDGNLEEWSNVSKDHPWSALLLGNGFSRNIWEKFGYNSLYEIASRSDTAHLISDDIALFDKFKSKNFEFILSALSTAKQVAMALNGDCSKIDDRSASIRAALIQAVHSVHIPWIMMRDAQMDQICAELEKFDSIYCSNYDLITYWAMMRNTNAFRDFFRKGSFNLLDADIKCRKTKVHFIHGGLHLSRTTQGETIKRKNEKGKNLLDSFEKIYMRSVPLFVSEGSADQKKASIIRSDYLSYTFSRLTQDYNPLVVFGHSLGETDKHIVDAIGAWTDRPIAVSIHADGEVRSKKLAILNMLPYADIRFFDAKTHPLGSANLRVKETTA